MQNEKATCNLEGLTFEQYPIKDRTIPLKKSFRLFIIETLNQIIQGDTIAVHCRGGIGRAGLVVCCILIEHGFTYKEAISLAIKARGCPVPDTTEQLEFIKKFLQL